MAVLVVGSVALDAVETPATRVDGVIGGSAVFFGAAASFFTDVRVVAVVGSDYPLEELRFLKERGVDFTGLEQVPGESFFWAGRYHEGFVSRDTKETRLGVFGSFDPEVPLGYRDAEVVFLGNIDPVLQLKVLNQMRAPGLVAADTMNFWIEGARDDLIELLGRVNILFVNDEEAMQLAGKTNLVRAARWIQDRGPGLVVVKKGVHGATLFAPGWVFQTPGYLVEEVIDPTGAGDAFAGGFLGYLEKAGSRKREDLKRAVVYGSVMGSYAVEAFSVNRFRRLRARDIEERARDLRDMTSYSSRASRGWAMIPRPSSKGPVTYREAGVDLDAAERTRRALWPLLAASGDKNTLSKLGAFGGLYALPDALNQPVLVSSADGVGTKLKVAFAAGRHDTVGQDLVNHCVNDILVQGARPLFFLDYLAVGALEDGVVPAVVSGISRACRENACVLLGGETAQMPDFYNDGEYDLAGFVVGLVERSRLIDGSAVRPGDRLVALPSSGLHTNGFTLARNIVFGRMGLNVDHDFPGEGASVAEVLLRVHRSYVGLVAPLLEGGGVKAMAHITGGGIEGNLPRVLPPGLGARIDCASWVVPAVFRVLEEAGGVDRREMYRVFNMGIGMILVIAPDREASLLAELGDEGWPLGEVVRGTRVELVGQC